MGLLTRSDLPETEIHDILRNQRRRHVINHLQETVGTVSLRELSERVAELEAGESPPPRDLRQSVYNSLHQTHLPKLQRKGIVEYDKARKTVRLTETARDVDLYMEVVTKYGITWAGFYRGLATGGFLALLAIELDAVGFEVIPMLLAVSFCLAIVAVSTAYQLWSQRWLYLQQLLE